MAFDDAITVILESSDLKKMWSNYQKQFDYAKNIEYDSIISSLKEALR